MAKSKDSNAASGSLVVSKADLNDDLAKQIAADINKLSKSGKIAFIGNEENPSDIAGYIETGNSLLDLAISNRAYGGVPFGRITEISGLEGSGKSLLCAHMIANVQKMGGIGIFIDTENAVDTKFFDAVGVDREKWSYVPMLAIEDIFEVIEATIVRVRSSSSERPVIIILDSLAGASTKAEIEGTYEKEGYGMEKAYLMSKALRKITGIIGKNKIALVITNQLRQKLNAQPFQDPYVTSGGKALGFHASVRIRLAQTAKITRPDPDDPKIKNVIGVKVKANVVKNRIGPAYRTAEFDVYFDRGVDNYNSWLQFLRRKNIITGVKSNALVYVSEKLGEFKFSEKDWKPLLESNKELKTELYEKLCNACIMAYQSGELVESDVEFDGFTGDE